MQYHNITNGSGQSTAQQLFEHPVADTLPAHHHSFLLKWQQRADESDTMDETAQEHLEDQYNARARDLVCLLEVKWHSSTCKLSAWIAMAQLLTLGLITIILSACQVVVF